MDPILILLEIQRGEMSGFALRSQQRYRIALARDILGPRESIQICAVPEDLLCGRGMMMTPGELDITQLQKSYERGELTVVEFYRACLKRIADIDQSGPKLNSIAELNPAGLEIATQLDEDRLHRDDVGPLHGVPILVKDSIDTGDGMMTTAGSLALTGNFAPEDAFVVQRLREAGALILGKTNMSEWGYMRSTRACSGWSSRGGQVRHPYVLDRNPCGSSSGSAVAVAANLCTAALGAEVDGSIVRPASINGIVGLKPTVGLLGRSGVIPVASPQDTVGPMARTVADVATLLSAMTGEDPRDPTTQESRGRASEDYCLFLKSNSLQGARLGVARDFFGFHEGTDAVIARAIEQLKTMGAVIVDPVDCGSVRLFYPAELELFMYEFKAGLNSYLAEHPHAKVRSLDELIEFNRKHASSVMPFFQQELLEMAQSKGDLDDQAYLDAKAECRRVAREEGIDRALQRDQLDAIVAPTDGTPAWVNDPVVGDKILGGCASPPAMAGYPHITVPAGYVHGLPVGLSLFSDAYQEGKLIGYAYAFEQATLVRRPPEYLESIDA